MLDYGAGKGRLAQSIQPDHAIYVSQYDPCVEEISERPKPSEFVACVDVLEHIEPDCLDEVLDDLKMLTRRIGFFSVTEVPAKKTLSDGRNAHLIQESPEWWLPKIMQRFSLSKFIKLRTGFYVVVKNGD